MYALPDDAVKEEHELLRSNAKKANFSLAFGMGLETFYKRLRGDRPEITIVEADAIRQAWLNTFYDVALWQKLHAADFPPQRLRRDPARPALALVVARSRSGDAARGHPVPRRSPGRFLQAAVPQLPGAGLAPPR